MGYRSLALNQRQANGYRNFWSFIFLKFIIMYTLPGSVVVVAGVVFELVVVTVVVGGLFVDTVGVVVITSVAGFEGVEVPTVVVFADVPSVVRIVDVKRFTTVEFAAT